MARAPIPQNLSHTPEDVPPRRFVPSTDALMKSSDYHVALMTRAVVPLALGHRLWLANVKNGKFVGSFSEYITHRLAPIINREVFTIADTLLEAVAPARRVEFVKNGSFFAGMMGQTTPTVWIDPARDELNEAYSELMEKDITTMAAIAVFHAENVRFPRKFPVGTKTTMEYVPAQMTGTAMVAVSSRTYNVDQKTRDDENNTFIPVLLRNVVPFAPTAVSAILYRLRYNRLVSSWKAANLNRDERQILTPNMIVLVVVKPDPYDDSNLLSLALFSPVQGWHIGRDEEHYLVDLQGTLAADGNIFVGKCSNPTEVDNYVNRALAVKGVNDIDTTRVHFAAYVYDNELSDVIFARFDTLVQTLSTNMSTLYGGIANIKNKVEFYGFPEYADAHQPKKTATSSARAQTLTDLDDA